MLLAAAAGQASRALVAQGYFLGAACPGLPAGASSAGLPAASLALSGTPVSTAVLKGPLPTDLGYHSKGPIVPFPELPSRVGTVLKGTPGTLVVVVRGTRGVVAEVTSEP